MDSVIRTIIALGCEAPSLGELRAAVLPTLAAEIGVETAMWGAWGGALSGGAVWELDASMPEHIFHHWSVYAEEMQPIGRAIFQRRVVADTDVMGKALADMAFTREVKNEIGAEATLYCLVDGSPRQPSVLVFNRNGRRGRFGRRTQDMVRAVRPALCLAEAAVMLREQAVDDALGSLGQKPLETLEMLRLGYTNAQIALAEGISSNTVRNRLARMYKHFGVGSRAELVAVAGVPINPRLPRKVG